MGITKVVNLKDNPFDVYIGRAKGGRFDGEGIFGNPFVMNSEIDRPKVVSDFRVYFYERLKLDKEFASKVLSLKGKTLGCFCKPKACHGDIICEYLNSLEDNHATESDGTNQ